MKLAILATTACLTLAAAAAHADNIRAVPISPKAPPQPATVKPMTPRPMVNVPRQTMPNLPDRSRDLRAPLPDPALGAAYPVNPTLNLPDGGDDLRTLPNPGLARAYPLRPLGEDEFNELMGATAPKPKHTSPPVVHYPPSGPEPTPEKPVVEEPPIDLYGTPPPPSRPAGLAGLGDPQPLPDDFVIDAFQGWEAMSPIERTMNQPWINWGMGKHLGGGEFKRMWEKGKQGSSAEWNMGTVPGGDAYTRPWHKRAGGTFDLGPERLTGPTSVKPPPIDLGEEKLVEPPKLGGEWDPSLLDPDGVAPELDDGESILD